MSTENHINESILSDEIKEHQKKNRIDHMKYMPDMEVLESDILDKVLNYVENYSYETYTEADVKRALSHERKTPEDFIVTGGTAFAGRNCSVCEGGKGKIFW